MLPCDEEILSPLNALHILFVIQHAHMLVIILCIWKVEIGDIGVPL